ncbi:MAG TPA: hypothetical protein VGH80_04650 [Xanthomonadaceae bacterium]|jgi:hypothetical protein
MSHLTARIFALAAAVAQWLCTGMSHWSPTLAGLTHCALTTLITYAHSLVVA